MTVLPSRGARARIPRATVETLRTNWRGLLDALDEGTLRAIDKQGVEFHSVIIDASGQETLAGMLDLEPLGRSR